MKKLLSICILLFATAITYAQTVNFRAVADKTELAKNEQVKITFKINANGSRFKAPDFPSELKYVSGPNKMSQTLLRNFEMEVEESYSFEFIAKEEGKITIPPASVIIKGRTYTTKPIELIISGELDRSKDPNDPYNIASKNIFLKVDLSKSEVYLGEGIIATYKLYYRDIGISGVKGQTLPPFDGFYQREIEVPNNRGVTENYKGRRYNVATLKQVTLIPQKTGEIEIAPMEIELVLQMPTRQADFFGRPLTKEYIYTSKTDTRVLKVKALPLEGRPKSFNGAVGQYSFSSKLNKDEVEANQSISITLNLSGKGNLPLFDVPELTLPPTIEAYDPKYNERISVSNAGLKGSKSKEYLLIPRYAGAYKIAPVQFTYFDPNEKQYKTIESEAYTIKVTGGEPLPSGAETSVPTPTKEEVELLDRDIRFVKTGAPNLVRSNKDFFNTTKFYSFLVSSILLFIIFLGVQKQMQVRNSDKSAVKNRNAARLARKHLSDAKKQLKTKNREAFYEALVKGLWGYLSDKLNIEMAKLNKDSASNVMQKRSVESNLIDETMALIDRCEFARFAPDSGTIQQEGEYEKAVSLIGKLEKQL